MPRRSISFEAADLEELYRGGRPDTWEEFLKRAEQAAGRRRRVSEPESYDMAFALRLLRCRHQFPSECLVRLFKTFPGPQSPAAR